MPDEMNSQVLDSQTSLNWKMFSDEPLSSAATRVENGTANQQIVQALMQENLAANLALSRQATADSIAFARANTARAVRFAYDISAEQAVGFATTIGAQLQDRITNLGAALSGVQEMVKIAITTPPQTGSGGAFGSDAGSALFQQIQNTNALVGVLRELINKEK